MEKTEAEISGMSTTMAICFFCQSKREFRRSLMRSLCLTAFTSRKTARSSSRPRSTTPWPCWTPSPSSSKVRTPRAVSTFLRRPRQKRKGALAVPPRESPRLYARVQQAGRRPPVQGAEALADQEGGLVRSGPRLLEEERPASQSQVLRGLSRARRDQH